MTDRDLRALAAHIRTIGGDAKALERRLIAEGVPKAEAWAAAQRYEEEWTRALLEKAEDEGEE